MPPEDIQTAKFYFRSTAYSDYYYVELTLGQSRGRAIAPKAQPDTVEVTFYTELVTRSFSAFRTEERTVPVASGAECKRRDPETAFYSGQNPDIAVGATRLGTTPLPPGFQADGISRFLSATGITGEAGGGGVSGKAIGIIAAVGGGGAAALALSGGGSSETTTTVIGGITTTNVSISSTSTAIGGVTSTTTTVGGGGSTSSTTTTVGGGSTSTIFGSTTTSGGSTTTIIGSSTTTIIGSSTSTSVGTSSTTSVGSSTTTIGSSTTTAGTSSTTSSTTTTTSVPTTTTSSPTTTTSAPSTTTTSAPTTTTSAASTSTTTAPASGADVRLDSIGDNPDPVVTGGVVRYLTRVTNLGPSTSPNVVITYTMPSSDRMLGGDAGCVGGFGFGQCVIGNMGAGTNATKNPALQLNGAGSHTITATVGGGATDPNLGNNQRSQATQVTSSLRTTSDSARVLELLSTLDVRPLDGRVRARIMVNDTASGETTNSGPRTHTLAVHAGENRAAAQVGLRESDSGTWRFDFSATKSFVPGSLRVQSGPAIALDANSITFAIDDRTPELRFTFEMSEVNP